MTSVQRQHIHRTIELYRNNLVIKRKGSFKY